MTIERITVDEAHGRMKAQGVRSREHIAFICPICGTVQSMASLVVAGAKPERVENYVGFSCEGRFNSAGPWPSSKDKTKKAERRRKVRGCDWTLGGLLSIHRLEVIGDNGKAQPSFEIATADQAQALEREFAI